MAGDTIFARILRGEIPCDEVYSDDSCLAFRDVAPAAPVHLLVIPRKPLESLREAEAAEEAARKQRNAEKKAANAAEEEEESADNAVKERMRRATMAKKGPTPPGVGGEAGGGATDAGAGAAEL